MNSTLDDLQAALDAYKAHQQRIPKRSHRIDRWWQWWMQEEALRQQLMMLCGLLFMWFLDEEDDPQD